MWGVLVAGEHRRSLIASFLGIPAAILAIVVGGIFTWNLTEGMRSESPQPTVTVTVTAPAEANEAPAVIPETGSQSETAAVVDPAPIPISLADRVDGQRCLVPGNSGYSWADGTAPIAGTPYTSGFRCPMSFTHAVGYLDFLVPASASRFTAVAGQPDDTTNVTTVIRFEIVDVVAGTVLASQDLAFGQAANFDVPVSDATRVRLQVSMLTFSTSPRDRSASAAWAEPTFRP